MIKIKGDRKDINKNYYGGIQKKVYSKGAIF